MQFSYKRAHGRFGSYLRNRFIWYYYPRLHWVPKFPDHVDIEISSACDMKCPMCYTTAEYFKSNVKRQFMDFDLFRKMIDECAHYGTYSIRLSLRGEPFLHKDVIKMIRYAREKGIKEVATLSNNLALSPKLFKEAMEAGLSWLTLSFDGLYDTYEWIRRPAKFHESYEKIKEYKKIKERAGSYKPVVKVQSVWPAIKDCAEEYCRMFEPYVDGIASNPLIDYLHKDREVEYVEDFECHVLYQRLSIGSDGMVMMCVNDEFCLHPLGDANKQSLYEIWHGEELTKIRDIHRAHEGVRRLEPCKSCYYPRKTQPVIENIGDKKIVVDKYTKRTEEIGT